MLDVTPKKRGPKPKRKAVEDETKNQDTEPKKKLRRKKDAEEKMKDEAKGPCEVILQEIKIEPVAPAPQLVSVDVTRNSVDREELPQLSPQVPLDERRLSLPGPPPVIPQANLPVAEVAAVVPPPKEQLPSPVVPVIQPEEQASCSRVLMDNTPPDTPERLPSPQPRVATPPPQMSPVREDTFSTASEKEANMEVEKLMEPPGSPMCAMCDTSTISNGSSGGSSGNAPGSESDEMTAPKQTKRKMEEEEEVLQEKAAPAKKRRRRGAAHKRGSTAEEKTTMKKTTSKATGTNDISISDA